MLCLIKELGLFWNTQYRVSGEDVFFPMSFFQDYVGKTKQKNQQTHKKGQIMEKKADKKILGL